MEKKTLKVKKKKVKLKKKKTVKKKRKRRKKINMEDLYRVLNKVQLKKKEAKFVSEVEGADIIEHIIQDVELDYKRIDMKTQVSFIIYPTDREEDYEMLEVEYLDDEIVEEGQIFP